MNCIHPTSIIDPNANIADGVKIGPFCTIGPNVTIGAGCELVSHCSIDGFTTLGENNKLSPFVTLGQPPQDLDWAYHRSYLNIGSNNQFREGFTAHPGTTPESATTIGNNCIFMNHAHVAHNCTIADHVIFVNSAIVAGYADIAERAILSGNTSVHQFNRMGRYTMLGGNTALAKDLPPFMMFASHNSKKKISLNLVGMRRSGFSNKSISGVRKIYSLLFSKNLTPSQAITEIQKDSEVSEIPEVKEIIEFIETSKRGIIREIVTIREKKN